MMAITKPRSSRSRCKSGCNTCKIRKIKCGEERPSCARCITSGWKCPGYGGQEIFDLDGTSAEVSIKSLVGAAPNLFLSSPTEVSDKGEPAVGTAEKNVNDFAKNTTAAPPKKKARRGLSTISKSWEYDSFSNLLVKTPSSSSLAMSMRPISPAAHEVPFTIPGTSVERQLFQYFCLQAAPDLSGYSSQNFWKNKVLTLCYYEPAVRHAALALGALHQEYVMEGITKSGQERINANALQQYNKALRHLQIYFSNKNILYERTVLICCKLFYCIEVARRDYSAALRHAKSGLNILKDWKYRQEKHSTSNMNTSLLDEVNNLVDAWCAFDAQIRIFENGKPPYVALTSLEERSGSIPCVPERFYSLSHAWEVLNKLMNWGLHFLASRIEEAKGLPENTEIGNLSEMPALEDAITQWPMVFDNFMHSPETQIPSLDEDSATMCATVYRGIKILFYLSAGQSALEMNDDFNDILTMAEAIIAKQDMETKSSRGFGFETGLVATLWLLATNCQEETMRARALWLMKAWPKREGLWDGATMSERVQLTAQSGRRLEEYPTAWVGKTEECRIKVKGEFCVGGFSKVLGVLERKWEVEEGIEESAFKLDGAEYPV